MFYATLHVYNERKVLILYEPCDCRSTSAAETSEMSKNLGHKKIKNTRE